VFSVFFNSFKQEYLTYFQYSELNQWELLSERPGGGITAEFAVKQRHQ